MGTNHVLFLPLPGAEASCALHWGWTLGTAQQPSTVFLSTPFPGLGFTSDPILLTSCFLRGAAKKATQSMSLDHCMVPEPAPLLTEAKVGGRAGTEK